MADRKMSIRMCVSCRETSEKRALMRIVRGADGQARIDPSGKAPGRGAYLCGAKECLRQAIKGKRLGKALRCEISAELVSELQKRVLPAGGEGRAAMGGGVEL